MNKKSVLLFLLLIIILTNPVYGEENERVTRWFVNNATGEIYKPPLYVKDTFFVDGKTGRHYSGLNYCLKMVQLGQFTVIIPDTPTPTPTPTPLPPTATPYPTPAYRASAKYYEDKSGKMRIKIMAEGEWNRISLLVFIADTYLGSIDQSGPNLWQGDLGIPERIDVRQNIIWLKDNVGNNAKAKLAGRFYENTQAVYTPSEQYWANYEKNRQVIESNQKFLATPTPVKYIKCKKCSGTGTLITTVHTLFGEMKKTIQCPECNGEGRIKVKADK